jgi:hypothetical protein
VVGDIRTLKWQLSNKLWRIVISLILASYRGLKFTSSNCQDGLNFIKEWLVGRWPIPVGGVFFRTSK